MDKLLRFSDYDVFAYIASGFAAMAVWDLLFSTHFVVGAQWSASEAVLAVTAAYVTGHILAAPSSWLLERVLVRRVLGSSSINLMSARPHTGWRGLLARSVLADYYTPLDASVAGRLSKQGAGEGLFWRAYPVAKANPVAYARIESFLKLYGFCRNIAFVALLGATALACKAAKVWACFGWSETVGQSFRWSLIALVVGLGMLHRYLKFHRLFSVEVLTTFAERER